MQITRNSLDTAAGPDDWFTGTVHIDTVATPSEPSRVAAASVHFTPAARTAWHTHPAIGLPSAVWVRRSSTGITMRSLPFPPAPHSDCAATRGR